MIFATQMFFTSKIFGWQLVTMDWRRCIMCLVVFPHFIIASKNYAWSRDPPDEIVSIPVLPIWFSIFVHHKYLGCLFLPPPFLLPGACWNTLAIHELVYLSEKQSKRKKMANFISILFNYESSFSKFKKLAFLYILQ